MIWLVNMVGEIWFNLLDWLYWLYIKGLGYVVVGFEVFFGVVINERILVIFGNIYFL